MTNLTGLLDDVKKISPVINDRLDKHGRGTLQSYLDSISASKTDSYQPTAEVADVAADYARRLLGNEIAEQLRLDLLSCPQVLTANHHGVDFFAQSVQGSMIFSQRRINGQRGATVPVFACGSIAMNNLTYPRGALLYNTVDADLPIRVPLFPDRIKRQMVACTAPFTVEMLERMSIRAKQLISKAKIDCYAVESLVQTVENGFLNNTVLAQTSYSDQSVLLNHRLWQKMFPDGSAGTMVCLELEKLVQPLLLQDLQDPDSLMSLLLFSAQNCERLVTELNGVRGCWFNMDLQHLPNDGTQSGTFMFWGVSGGRRVGLGLNRIGGQYCLTSADNNMEGCIGLTPETLSQALSEGSIMPSLFTCYSLLALARGIDCAGGYYQAEYLPEMQRGVVKVLSASAEFAAVAEKVERITTSTYLSGMQGVLCHNGIGAVPAGPLEIIAAGGINKAGVERMIATDFISAHLASLRETVPDVLGKGTGVCWTQLAKETAKELNSKVLIV